MLAIYLDRPPSLNNLFPTAGKNGVRRMSPGYKAWRETQGRNLMPQRPKPVPGPVHITITVRDDGPGDLDNLAKAPVDLLVHLGLIDGDSRKIVRAIDLRWGDPVWTMTLGEQVPMGCLITVVPGA